MHTRMVGGMHCENVFIYAPNGCVICGRTNNSFLK
jgi:hypothetical protein